VGLALRACLRHVRFSASGESLGLRRCEAFGVFPGSFRPPTMPSADSCPITDRVTPAGAVEPSPVRLGFAALVPSAASACDGRPGRLVRRSPVPAVVPEATRKHPTATSGRSPRIRAWTFAAQPRHLPCSRTSRSRPSWAPRDFLRSRRSQGFVVLCQLAPALSLLWRFCPSARSFASRFLQTPPRGDALAIG